jgi:hypothetical protein
MKTNVSNVNPNLQHRSHPTYRLVRYMTPRVRKGTRVVHRMSAEDVEIIANIERCELAISVLKRISTFGADRPTIGVCIQDVQQLRQTLRAALRERLKE